MTAADVLRYGPIRYPSPLGDLHLSRAIDEITLMRLIDGMRDCALNPRTIISAHIHDDSLITFEFYDTDSNGKWLLNEHGGLAIRTITAGLR